MKRLGLILLITCNLNAMQKLVLRCSKLQMVRISRGLTSEVFGSTIRELLNNTVRSIVADEDRKHYTFTFDLHNKYIGDTPEKQMENLKEIFDFITVYNCKVKPVIIREDEEIEPCRYGS